MLQRMRSTPCYPIQKMHPTIHQAFAFLALPLAVAAQAAEPPSPIPAADLYIKTLVNHDEQAIRQLNDYLRPDRLRSGRSADYADLAALQAADKAFPGEITEIAVKLFPQAMRDEMKAPLESLMSTVQQARQKSECKALSSEPPTMASNGVLTAQVAFECSLVKTQESWAAAIQRLVRSNADVTKSRSDLQALQAAYAAPVSVSYRGVFPLSMVPKDKNEAWRNDFARETFDEMLSQF